MSSTVDQRVVEMRFDNRQFEAQVSKSMGTIEKLKHKLSFEGAAENVGKVTNSIASSFKNAFSTVGSILENGTIKFNKFGIAANAVITKITQQAVDAGERLVKSLSIDQVTSGWQKYADKTANVQTIMNATGKSLEEVNDVLGHLMWYSDETSYSFSEMSQALGIMTAAGGDVEDLIPMIEGIANATSFAGRGAAEFSRAIYNVNQAYSKGKFDLTDWKSLEMANVTSAQLKQTLIDTAVEMGTLDASGRDAKGTFVDILNFSETLKNDWLTKDVMARGFGKFAALTDAVYEGVQNGTYELAAEGIADLGMYFDDVAVKAFKAAQEAKSFQEAIDATKDAVSTGWMKTFEAIFGNFEEAKQTWTELCEYLWDIFASTAESRVDFITTVFDKSDWSYVTKQISDAGFAVSDFNEEVKRVATEVHGIPVSQFGSIEYASKNGIITTEIFSEALANFAEQAKKSSPDYYGLTDDIIEYADVMKQVLNGELGEGAKLMENLKEKGYDYYVIMEKLRTLKRIGLADEFEKLSFEEFYSLGYLKGNIELLEEMSDQSSDASSKLSYLIEQMQSPEGGREYFLDAARAGFDLLLQLIDTVKEAFANIFPADIERNKAIKVLRDIGDAAKKLAFSEKSLDKFRRSFEGVFAILSLGRDVIVEVAYGIADLLSYMGFIGDGVLDTTASIGDNIVAIKKWIDENEIVRKTVRFIVSEIKILIDIVSVLADKFKEFVYRISQSEKIQSFVTFIKDEFGYTLGILQGYLDSTTDSADTLFGSLSRIVDKIDTKGIADRILNLIDSFDVQPYIDMWTNFTTKTKELGQKAEDVSAKLSIKNTLTNLTSAFNGLSTSVTGLGDSFTGFFNGLDTGKMADVAEAGLAISGSFSFLSLAGKFKETLQNFAKVGDKAAGALAQIGKYFQFMQTKVKVSIVMEIAAAILLIAGAIALLSLVPVENLVPSALAVLGTMTILLGILVAVAKIANLIGGITLVGVGTAIAGMGLAMIELAAAIAILNAIEIKSDFGKKVWTTVLLFAELVVAVEALSVVAPLLTAGAIGILAVVTALGLLIGILWLYAKLKTEDIQAGANNMKKAIEILGKALFTSSIANLFGVGSVGKVASIISLIFSLLAIAGLIKLFAKIRISVPDITKSIVGLGSCIYLLSKLVQINGKYVTDKSNSQAKNIIALSISLLMISATVSMLGKIPLDELAKGVAAVDALMLGLAQVLKSTNGLTNDLNPKTFLALAGVIGVLVVSTIAMELLLKDEGSLLRMIESVGLLEILLQSLRPVFKTLGEMGHKDNKNLAKSIIPMIGVAVMIGGLVAAVSFLAKYKWNELVSACGGLESLMFSFAGVLAAMQKILKVDGNNKVSVAWRKTYIQIIKMIPSIVLLAAAAGAIKFLMSKSENVNWDDYVGAATGLFEVMGILVAGMMGINTIMESGSADLKKLGSALLNLIPVIVLMGAAVVALWLVNNLDEAKKKADALSEVIGVIAGTLVANNLTSVVGSGGWQNILSLAGVIIAIGAAISIISKVGDVEQVSKISDLMSKLLGITGAVSAIISLIGSIGGAVSGQALVGNLGVCGILLEAVFTVAISFIILSAMITAASYVLSGVNMSGFDNIVEITDKLSTMLERVNQVIFGGKNPVDILGNFLERGLPVIDDFIKSLSETFKEISKIDVSNADNIAKLSGALAALIASDGISKLITWSDKLLTLTTAGIFGGESTNVASLVDPVIELVSKLDEASGEIKNIDTLPAFTESFCDVVKAVTQMPRSGGLTGLILGNPQDLKDTVTGITSLIPTLRSFISSASIFSNESIEKSKSVTEIIRLIGEAAQAAPETASVKSFIAGRADLQSLIGNLTEIAKPLVSFKNVAVDIAPYKDSMTKALNIIKKVIELSNETLPYAGDGKTSLMGIILGEQGDLVNLIAGLKAMAEPLGEFSAKASEIASNNTAFSDMDRLLDIIDHLVIIGNSHDNSEFALGWLEENFSEWLIALNDNVDDIATLITKIKEKSFKSSDVENVNRFKAICNALWTSISGIVAGNIKNVDKVFGDLEDGVDSLKAIILGLNDIDMGIGYTKMIGFTKVIKMLTDFVVELDDDISVKADHFKKSMSSFQLAVSSYGDLISSIQTAMEFGVDNLQWVTFMSRINNIADFIRKNSDLDNDIFLGFGKALADFPEGAVENVSEAFSLLASDGNGTLSEAVKVLTDGVVSGTENNKEDMVAAWTEAGKEMAGGLKVKEVTDELAKSAKSVATTVITSLNSYLLNGVGMSSMKEIGKNALLGFKNGFDNSDIRKEIAESAKSLGNTVSESTAKALDERSPSKKMRKIGLYAGEGLLIGLQSYINKVGLASYDMGDEAVTSMQESINNLNNIVYGSADWEPVMKPTMDLSDIANKASQIDGMFTSKKVNAELNAEKAAKEEFERADKRFNSISDTISKALDKERNTNVTVEMTPNTRGIFSAMIKEKQIWEKSTAKESI